jgi:hypothetical protein
MYPHKSVAIAFVLSFLIPGIGQIYVGKIKRGIVYILLLIILYAATSALTMNIDVNDVASVTKLISDPWFIGVTVASLGVWAFNLYDAFSQATKYNEASMRNDLARFLKKF